MPRVADNGDPKPQSRETRYSKLEAQVCEGEKAITANQARELLGWSQVDKGGGNYSHEVAALTGQRVRMINNVTNRPLYINILLSLRQEILRRKWRFNGEPIIIGKTGLVLNGQHSLIGLIAAVHAWVEDKEKWQPYWKTEPVMEKMVVYGVDESDDTVNTMDTCKARSLLDVICRSGYFADMTESQRKRLSRMTDYCVRLLWHRTGAGLDAFAPRRTHSESLDFLTRHPKILDCVKHVHEEDGKEGKIVHYVSTGYASALLYLMGSSASDRGKYLEGENPNGDLLDWSHWGKACNFWTHLAGGSKEVAHPVRAALAAIDSEGGPSNGERWGILCNAWNCYVDEGRVHPSHLKMMYTEDEDGVKHLADCPTVGGIDIGDPNQVDEKEVPAKDPTPEEITKRAAVVRRKKDIKNLRPKRAGDEWAKGDVAWVYDEDGPYLARLTEDPASCDDGRKRVMVESATGIWEITLTDLSLTRQEQKPKPTGPKSKPALRGKASTAVGDLLWVKDPNGEPWQGRVLEVLGKNVRLKIQQGHLGAGNVKEVPIAWTSKDQPEHVTD